MPNLPAHLRRYLTAVAVAQDIQEGMPEVHKLSAILKAAQGVVEEYSRPRGMVLHLDLVTQLDKLKEAMRDEST